MQPLAVPPQVPEEPLEQGTVGTAETVGLQAVGVHGLAFPGSSQAARRRRSGEMKCSQGPLQQQLDPCPQGLLLAYCSGQKTLGLNLWAPLWGQRRWPHGPWEQVEVTTW